MAAKKWLWKAKILIMTIRVNLVLNHSETWTRQYKCTWIVIIKILHLANHHSHLVLAATLDFTSFSITAFLGDAHFFLQLGCFGLDSYYQTMPIGAEKAVFKTLTRIMSPPPKIQTIRCLRTSFLNWAGDITVTHIIIVNFYIMLLYACVCVLSVCIDKRFGLYFVRIQTSWMFH